MRVFFSYSSGSLGVVFTITPQGELTASLTTQLGSSVGSILNQAIFTMPDNSVASVADATFFIQMENGDISNRKFVYYQKAI